MYNVPAGHLRGETQDIEDVDSFSNHYFRDRNEQSASGLVREQLQGQIDALNETLRGIFNERISADKTELGDLFAGSAHEVEKTVRLIKSLLSMRSRDIENRNQLHSALRKLEAERNQQHGLIERAQKESKKLEQENESLCQKMKAVQKQAKEGSDKLTQERDEAQKLFKAIQARENQYRNENRRLQLAIKALQEKLAKTQDKLQFRNNFEVFKQLSSFGPILIAGNSEHEYNQMVAKNMEERYSQLMNENNYYRDYLQNIQRGMQAVLEVKREALRKRSCEDEQSAIRTSNQGDTYPMLPLKAQTMNLPLQYGRESLQVLNENVSRFKEAIKAGEAERRDNDQKVNCVNKVRNLIRNYKSVVQSQDQLLNKVILKAKEFKANEMQILQRNYSQADQDEIEKARRFLEQQSSYLSSKNKQLELTRKAMQATIRKAEEDKRDLLRRDTQMSEEVQRIKEQIQILPMAIEQQLGVL